MRISDWSSDVCSSDLQQQQARGEAAIHNQAQLDDYLRRHVASGEPTPLDAFSDGARERFRSDLVWGSDGLGGFNRGDLAEELGDAQIHPELGLFGKDSVAYDPPRRPAAISRHRNGRTSHQS